jgi:hypothetical protein
MPNHSTAMAGLRTEEHAEIKARLFILYNKSQADVFKQKIKKQSNKEELLARKKIRLDIAVM